MYQIFISYQHNDREFAYLLKMHLEMAGIATWMDRGELIPGDEWRDSIDQAIKESSALIAVMSPDARASEYVTYEWAYAWGAGVPVMPIVIRPDTDLHPRLEVLQFIRFTDKEQPWEELIKAVESIARGKSIRSVPIPRHAMPYVKQAIAALDAATAAERKGAIETLAQANDVTAIEALKGALQHRLRDVRLRAAAALAASQVVDKQVATVLHEPWYSEEDLGQEMRDLCWEAFKKAGPALIYPLLEVWIDKDNPAFREAYSTLSRCRDDNEMALREAFLNKENPKEIRIAAMRCNAEKRYTSAEWDLQKVLTDNDEDVRRAASEAIARIKVLEEAP